LTFPARRRAREHDSPPLDCNGTQSIQEASMERYLLLWLLGVPLPILVLIYVLGGLH
jgi:hypothetical protein